MGEDAREVSDLADALGLDTNGLLNMMIRRELPHWRLEVQKLSDVPVKNVQSIRDSLFSLWRTMNPSRPKKEFDMDMQMIREGKGEPLTESGLPLRKLAEIFAGLFYNLEIETLAGIDRIKFIRSLNEMKGNES
jgi:hypothetical protein